MTDDPELDEFIAEVFREVIRRSLERGRARNKGETPTIIGGQIPVEEYAADRPVTGVEARRELTAQEELEAWFREVAVSNELD